MHLHHQATTRLRNITRLLQSDFPIRVLYQSIGITILQHTTARIYCVAAVGRILAYQWVLISSMTNLAKSRALETLELDRPVESENRELTIPNSIAFVFIAATNAEIPPG